MTEHRLLRLPVIDLVRLSASGRSEAERGPAMLGPEITLAGPTEVQPAPARLAAEAGAFVLPVNRTRELKSCLTPPRLLMSCTSHTPLPRTRLQRTGKDGGGTHW